MEIDQQILEYYIRTHTSEALKEVEKLTESEIITLIKTLDPKTGSILINEMNRFSAMRCMEMIDSESGAALISELSMVEAARILRNLPSEPKKMILSKMEDEQSFDQLLSYPDSVVGAYMNPAVLTLVNDQKVEHALQLTRSASLYVTSPIFVLNKDQVLKGSVPFRSLLTANPQDTIKSIMYKEVKPVEDRDPAALLLGDPRWESSEGVLPVVDANKIFIGVIDHQDLEDTISKTKQKDEAALHAGVAMGDLYRIGINGIIRSIAESSTSSKNN